MHYNFKPLKLYRMNRVMNFGDTFPPTRLGEEILLPDIQQVRDLERLGAIEPVRSEEETIRLKKWRRYDPLPLSTKPLMDGGIVPDADFKPDRECWGEQLKEACRRIDEREEQQYRRKARELFRRVVAAFKGRK